MHAIKSRILAVLVAAAALAAPAQAAPDPAVQRPQAKASTADHSKFKELEGPFATGPEVTKACLACHTEAAKQVHKTKHWTWKVDSPKTGQPLGKSLVINNFCGNIETNYPRCTSCHIGYGWKDKSFDFANETAVDCLVCHDTTGSYKKFPAGAGHPPYQDTPFQGQMMKAVDLVKVAKGVGPTSRATCGACHFLGGGGDAVKHGDIDTTLAKPNKALDVHMDAEGLNFSCSTCHTSNQHEVAGSRYVTKAVDRHGLDIPGKTDGDRATCESCHGWAPHKDEAKLNDHTDVVACPTCHVPEFARGGKKTKMVWDWSTAGKLKDGKPFKEHGADGDDVYDSLKGSFVWQANVVPEYLWFDGSVRYTNFEKIDDSSVVPINSFGGGYGQPDSRIWPFKAMRGKQAYDKFNKNLVYTHTFGKDDAAYWGNFDWPKAIAAGMKDAPVKYSGEFGFVDTVYYWPITHMVAPKEKALECDSCHSRDGRLAKVGGFYLPGRDRFALLDMIGWTAAGLTLLGALGHALLRLVAKARKE